MRKFLIRIRGYIFKIYLHLLGVKKVGHSLTIRKSPIVTVKRGGEIRIGDNVVLNSKNRGYHVNMFAPMKFVALGGVIEIGDNSRIHGTSLHAKKRISIGKNCLIAANTIIMDSNSHELSLDKPEERLIKKDLPKEVIIEDNVWIAANVIILPGIHIGHDSVIAAGSVVVKDVPPQSLVGGNPAKVIKMS
jgi:acetyltransferase-like isoleucine patch superfamily enzyme